MTIAIDFTVKLPPEEQNVMFAAMMLKVFQNSTAIMKGNSNVKVVALTKNAQVSTFKQRII